MSRFNLLHPRVKALKSLLGIKGAALGRGYFSAVYDHPTQANAVVKITTCPATIQLLEEGLRFYKLENSPHMPRVLDYLTEVNKNLGGLRVYILEKLEPMSPKDAVEAGLALAIQSLNNNWPTTFPAASLHAPELKKDTSSFKTRNRKLAKSIIQAASALGQFAADYGFNIDGFRGANVMRRGSTLVLNDPVFSTSAM